MKLFVYLMLAAMSSLLVLSLGLSGCASDDDDDDGGGQSFGQDIAGTYDVLMTVEVDDCNPDNEGQDPVSWFVDIVQNANLSVATVRYKEQGVGQEWIDLFIGDVYGTVILKAGVDTGPISGADCTKVSVENYSLKVDLETNTLSGRLTTDIFYMGNGCDSSNIDCHFVQVLTPAGE